MIKTVCKARPFGGLNNNLLPKANDMEGERGDDDHNHDDDHNVDVDDDVDDHLTERATAPDQIVFVVEPDVFY